MKEFQLAKKYFSLTHTKAKKKPCNVCFEKLDIAINGYKTLINNVDSYLQFITNKHSKFIDEIVPKHLQSDLFAGKEEDIRNLKMQWVEVKQQAINMMKTRIENRFYSRIYEKTMKGRCKAIIKHYNRKDEKRRILKSPKKVYYIDNIPIIIKFSEKMKRVIVSKTYGSHSYTDYEIELMEKEINQK